MPYDLLKDLLDKSYNLVRGGLSKKKQAEILGRSIETGGYKSFYGSAIEVVQNI